MLDAYASAQDQISKVRSGAVSARVIVDASLSRIAEVDSEGYRLNSILSLSADVNNEEFIDPHLPLAGLPVLIKDNIEAVGLPGSAGSLALENFPVKKDSTIVSRLRAAGAQIIGSTNLSEWANVRSTKSTSGWSGIGGLTANAWIHDRSAGGSSSGSGAAISAGLVSLAVGTETDGSIVCPSSLNGCVGIKPTVGSVPRDGVVPISESQDSPGSMARNVYDAALLLEIMMGKKDLANSIALDRPLRIGRVKSWFTGHDGTDLVFEDACRVLAKSGISLVDVDLAPPGEVTGNDEYEVMLAELFDDLGSYLAGRCEGKLNSLSDVVRFNQEHSATELQYFGQDLFDRSVKLGGRIGEYAAMRSRNLAWATQTLDKGLNGVDVLIGATYSPAWVSALGKGDDYANSSWITMAPAIAGTPIGSLPMGIVDGLPVGLGIVSRKSDERTLIDAMAKIEQILSLGILRPTFIR